MLSSSINAKEIFALCLFIEKVVVYLWLRRTQTPLPNTVHIMSQHITNAVDSLIASQDVEAITFTIEWVETRKQSMLEAIAGEPDEEQAVAYAISISEITRGVARLRSALVC